MCAERPMRTERGAERHRGEPISARRGRWAYRRAEERRWLREGGVAWQPGGSAGPEALRRPRGGGGR